jgi:hypothetical protein
MPENNPENTPVADTAINHENAVETHRLIAYKLFEVSNNVRDVARELLETTESDPSQLDTAARLVATCATVLEGMQTQGVSDAMARQMLNNPHRMRGVPLR